MGRPYVINHPPRIVRDFLFVSSEDDHMFFYKKFAKPMFILFIYCLLFKNLRWRKVMASGGPFPLPSHSDQQSIFYMNKELLGVFFFVMRLLFRTLIRDIMKFQIKKILNYGDFLLLLNCNF